MTSLLNLSREKLEALATLKQRGIDVTPFIEDEVTYTGAERLEEIDKIRRAGPVSFIRTYGYVLEPRPPIPDEQLDLDFEKYLKNIDKGENLTGEAFEIMPVEVKSVGDIKFDLWDFQVELIYWFDWLVQRGESGLVEKSRDMGYSWCYVWWAVFHFICTKSFSALFGSKKEAAVDNATVSSIFGKLDYALEKLPGWLKPKGYDRRVHRTRLKILNPENGNYLVGDSQTADFGASERHTVVIPDEAALWDRDPSGTISNTTNTAIYGSSVRGENHHYRMKLRLEARSTSLVRRLDWWLNPTHTQAWFKAMQARMDEADFAREVLIDYQASVKGKYYPICHLVKKVDRIAWQPGWPSDLAMDYGVNDSMAMIWWQKNHAATLHRMMYAYTNSGKPIEFYIPFMRAMHPDQSLYLTDGYGKQVLDQDEGQPIFKKLTEVYDYSEGDLAFIAKLQAAGVTGNLEYRGDPAGRQRSQDTATSIEQKLASVGIYVFSNTKLNDYLSRRSALTDILLKTEVNLEGAYDAFNAISQSRYPERRENSQATTPTNAPVHDWTSHYRSAAEYHAVGEENRGTVTVLGSQEIGTAPEQLTGISAVLARAKKLKETPQ